MSRQSRPHDEYLQAFSHLRVLFRSPTAWIQPPIGAFLEHHLPIAPMKGSRRWFEENPAMPPMGGEICTCEIPPAGMAERTLYRFEDFEATQHAAAAVYDRAPFDCEVFANR